ncbi:MAG: hypothetical protein WD357_02825 [Gracilimonas sp.]
MTWIKDAYLDVIILLFIVVFAFYANTVLEVVLWVYTSLLFISKILAFFMPSLQRKANNTTAPQIFYHIVYGLTVGILVYSNNYYLAGAWLAIWIVSVISLNSSKKKPT